MADEKLTPGRIRVLRSGHRNHPTVVVAVAELGFDLITGVTSAPAGFAVRVFSQRITALDHEILDYPVEASSVVESLLGQGFEILHGLRGDVGPKLNDHFAFGRANDGSFVIHNAAC